MDGNKIQNEMFNDIINDTEEIDNSSKNQNINKYIKAPQNFHKNNYIEDKTNDDDIREEKMSEYKLVKLRNELLTNQLREKERVLRDYKKKCQEQSKKIEELKKRVTENMLKQNIENNSKIQYNKKPEKKVNDYNKIKNEALIDQIETITYNIDNNTYFECGICMDSFLENETIKKLPCDHIFHTDCMSQWIQTNKICPLCDQAIFY